MGARVPRPAPGLPHGFSVGRAAAVFFARPARPLGGLTHAPSFLRVIGPVSNLPEFYQAYGAGPGDRMFRADSVRGWIW